MPSADRKNHHSFAAKTLRSWHEQTRCRCGDPPCGDVLLARQCGSRRARAPCRAPPRSRRCRTRCRRGSVGELLGRMKLRRRISTGSSPSSRAARSTMRSSTQLCTSDPNPRYAPCWHLFVKTPRARIRRARSGTARRPAPSRCRACPTRTGCRRRSRRRSRSPGTYRRRRPQARCRRSGRSHGGRSRTIAEAILHVLHRAAHDLGEHPGETLSTAQELRSEAAARGMRQDPPACSPESSSPSRAGTGSS